MHGFWKESNWYLDKDALVMPNGQRLRLKDILQERADRIEGRIDLYGKWTGWRIRQQFLIAPGGSIRRGRIAEHVMRHWASMQDWERLELQRRQLTLF